MKRHILMLNGLILLCGLISLNGFYYRRDQSTNNVYPREEIPFDSGHFKIVGDLHIPDPDKKQPVIVFVHGDGPARRRPSREPNRIMSHFLDIGFACFFYDKPGYGESTGKFTSGKLFKERASILVDAVRVLKNHPAVDSERIGVWGISQAGWVMPKAIVNSDDIAFMIAISCAGIDGVEQSAYLVEQQILCNGYSEAQAKRARKYYRQRAHAKSYAEYLEAAEYLDQNPVVSSMGWGGVKPKDRFKPPTPSNEGFFNPIPLIEKMTIPILAIFGEKDTQVDPFQASEAYKKALKKGGNSLNHVEVFPDADHTIMLAETGCIKEQRDRWRLKNSRGHVPGYLELMKNWLKKLN